MSQNTEHLDQQKLNQQIEFAVQLLQKGEPVALPTETVYGLAAPIDNLNAVQKIFLLKQRPLTDPLIVHVPDIATARKYSKVWYPLLDRLAEHFWPGPLTLLVQKSDLVDPLITSGSEYVALRCPAHPVFLDVLNKVGVPLAAPSANLFGRTSPTRAEHVKANFGQQVFVVDGGPCDVGIESTIVRIDPGPTLEILRLGRVTADALSSVVGVSAQHALSTGQTPGSMLSHYQPTKKLIIVNKDSAEEKAMRTDSHQNREIKLPIDAYKAAHVLFAKMYKADEVADVQQMFVVFDSELHVGQMWDSVWDRIKRAAARD